VVDAVTWRLLRLRAEERWPDGTLDVVEVETLQPPGWVAAHRARPGAWVPLPLDLLEMGLPETLRARVMANEPCPAIPAGPGSVVLTTVNHLNPELYELTLADAAGRESSARPTGLHKFYSEDRGAWTNTRDLRDGERLRSIDGPLTVERLARVPGVHRVYNLTVAGEHVFHVSSLGLLSHNNVACAAVGDLRAAGQRDAHHVIQDAAVRDLPGYDTTLAPGVQLPGPSTAVGSAHYTATQVQRQSGGGTYAAERRIGYKALRKAGVSKQEARDAIGKADDYFRSIGVTLNTPTRIPGNRR
jgi:hypothetical protein